jgi:glycosyltransferase involved in cell wall biosynthesis
MNKTPKVSILLPTYNGSHFLARAMESVLRQSYADFELLIIDDGSTDHTAKVVSLFSAKDPRVIYLKNEENLGIQKSLNKGLRQTRGEYIARIDDDDEWIDHDKLQAQVEFLNHNPEYVLIGTGAVWIDDKGEELYRGFNPETDRDIRRRILIRNCFIHSAVMFRKDAATKAGSYDESKEARNFEDYDLWLKLGLMGRLANFRAIGIKKTLRTGSIISANKRGSFWQRIAFVKRRARLISEYRRRYPNYGIALLRNYLRLIVRDLRPARVMMARISRHRP